MAGVIVSSGRKLSSVHTRPLVHLIAALLCRSKALTGPAGGARVHCGFDNDAGGNKLWQQVAESYPRVEAIVREQPPAGAKDGNDVLRAAPGRAEGQGQEDDRAPGRGRGHGGNGRDEHGHG